MWRRRSSAGSVGNATRRKQKRAKQTSISTRESSLRSAREQISKKSVTPSIAFLEKASIGCIRRAGPELTSISIGKTLHLGYE